MGSRVVAFIVDVVLMNIVVFGLFYVFQLNGCDADTFQDSSSAAAYCADQAGTDGACYAIGSTVYDLDGDQGGLRSGHRVGVRHHHHSLQLGGGAGGHRSLARVSTCSGCGS